MTGFLSISRSWQMVIFRLANPTIILLSAAATVFTPGPFFLGGTA